MSDITYRKHMDISETGNRFNDRAYPSIRSQGGQQPITVDTHRRTHAGVRALPQDTGIPKVQEPELIGDIIARMFVRCASSCSS
ncbi:hypothetical protein [Sphingobacterium suaedae]|uniref:Uncharacterized protein n=1 Tax=Sphingobacterium suaedae TaxID=1686402 RepID=A0ABW5KEN3_9SPHI